MASNVAQTKARDVGYGLEWPLVPRTFAGARKKEPAMQIKKCIQWGEKSKMRWSRETKLHTNRKFRFFLP